MNRKTATISRAEQAPRVRGWKIHIYRTQAGNSSLTPTIWSADIPQEWEATKNDPDVTRAELIRSGRKFQVYPI